MTIDWDQWLRSYAHAWQVGDTGDIAAHWAPDAFLFYKAEEITQFYSQWADVIRYWQQNEKLHERVVLRFTNASGQALTPELHLVTAYLRWDIRFAVDAIHADGSAFAYPGRAMGGETHVLMMFRGIEGQPKLVGWSETPDAAITYLRELYFRNADASVLD